MAQKYILTLIWCGKKFNELIWTFFRGPWKSDTDSLRITDVISLGKCQHVTLPLAADVESVLSLSPLILKLDSQGSQSPTQHYTELLSRSTKINEAHQEAWLLFSSMEVSLVYSCSVLSQQCCSCLRTHRLCQIVQNLA